MKRLAFLALTLSLACLLVSSAVAGARDPLATLAGCFASDTYDPRCDVNRDGVMDVVDIQLVASHWGQSGQWTPEAGDGWSLTGNAGTVPGTNFLGTTDNAALEVKVNNQRALRVEPGAGSPNWIAGFGGNSVSSGKIGASIGGGGRDGAINRVTADFGTIGGGENNLAGDVPVGGGSHATIGGGEGNWVTADFDTIGGGQGNVAGGGKYATIAGGLGNVAYGFGTTVAGGTNNEAGQYPGNGKYATVAGGVGNKARGEHSAIPGGVQNEANGSYSLAAGTRAKANHDGAFVWGDSTPADIYSAHNNQLVVRANGGIWLGAVTTPYTATISQDVFLATSTGGNLSKGGVWTNSSSRDTKTNFTPANAQAILARLAEVPVSVWSYKAENPATRHIGPTAQDFYAAFSLGADDRHITTVDADGVALAAIQGLYQVVQQKDARIQALEAEQVSRQAEINALQTQTAGLEARLAALEQGGGAVPAGGAPVSWLVVGGGLCVAGLAVVRRSGRDARG